MTLHLILLVQCLRKIELKFLKSVLSDLSKEIANFRVSDGTLLGFLKTVI